MAKSRAAVAAAVSCQMLLLLLLICWTPSASATVTWSFQKTGYHPAVVTYGTSLSYQVTATLPVGQTELRVEIYSASDTAALFAVCSPTITSVGTSISGANITELNSQWRIEDKGNDYRNERAILQFANLTTSAASNNEIVFEFGAMVLNSPRMKNNETYYVSFGVRYANNTKVWVGQAAYSWMNETANTSSVATAMSLSGPSSLMIGETGVFSVNLTAGSLLSQVIMDVFAPLNSTEFMSVCFVGFGKDSGSSYSCVPSEGNLTFPKRVIADPSTGEYHNAIATFDAGELINGMRRSRATNSTDDVVTFKIAAKMLNGCTVDTDYKLGVALQYNHAQIWTSSVNVTAKAANFVVPNPSPIVKVTKSLDEIRIGGSVSIFVNITLPKSSATNYTVEVAFPFNFSQAVMTFQRLRVLYVGSNMPCLHYANSTIKTVSSANDSNKDYVIFDLGPITNTGINNGLYDNDIAIEVVGLVLNHSLIASGGETKIVAGVRYGNAIWVSSQNYTVVLGQVSYPSAKAARIQLKNAMSSSIIYNGTTHAFYLEIFQPIGTQFESMDIEIISMMDNNRAVLSICDVQLLHVGEHFVNISGALKVTNISTGDDGRVDRVLVSFPNGILSNIGNEEYAWTAEKNTIRFQILTYISPHYLVNSSNLMNDSMYWLGASVKFEPNKLFVSRVGLTYDPLTFFSNISSSNEASISASPQMRNTTIWVGGAHAYNFNMTSIPQSYGNYSVDAVTMNSSLHICRVALWNRGKNVPCLGEMAVTTKTLENGTEHCVKQYKLDMPNFANVGQSPGTGYSGDDNSGLLQVVVQAKSGTSGENVSSGGVFYIGEKKLWVDGVTLTVNETAPAVAFTPIASVALRNGSESLVRNGMHTVVVEVYLPADSFGDYTVDVLVPFNSTERGKMHVCSIRLVSAGWNLPCINDTQLSRLMNDSFGTGSNDRGQIRLGPIQNIATGGSTVNPDNRFTVEADVFVNGSATTVGEVLWVGASVNISNSLVWIGSKSLTVTDVLPSATDLKPMLSPANTSSSTMYIFQEATFKFNVSMAEALVNFTLKFYSNLSNDEAVFSFSQINATYYGENFCCQEKLNFTTKTESTNNNTQMDIITANALVANTGVFRRHQWSGYHKDSDIIQFEVTARLMDAESAVNGSTHYIYCELEYGVNLTLSTSTPVIVHINSDDKTDLQIFQTEELNATAESKLPDAVVQLGLRLNHTEMSRGNAHTVRLFWYLPHVLGYLGVVSSTPFPVTVENKSDVAEGLLITFDRLAYTDDLKIVINVTVDPKRAIPMGSGVTQITLLSDTFFQSRNKPAGDASSSARNAYSPTFRFGIDVFIPDCFSALGMQSGAIADCQITSSGNEGEDTAVMGRYASSKAWSSPHRGKPYYGNEYLEINLGNSTRVTAIRLQGHNSDASHRVDTFWLQYSYEGLIWFDVMQNSSSNKQIYSANYTGGSAYVQLQKAVTGRYIRILPLSGGPKNFSRSMRVELYGCMKSADVAAADACYQAPVQAAGFNHSRQYLVNPSDASVYICIPRKPGGRSYCSSSADLGNTWQSLDTVVSQIGYLTTSNSRLYGTASDGRSRIRSDDGGWTWYSIPEEEYDTNVSGATLAKAVPWSDFTDTTGTLFATYGFTCNSTHHFSVAMNGVYATTDNKATWSLVAFWGQDGWL